MSQLERQQQILDVLNALKPNESISIKEIAAKIFSSESSVRRAVNILVQKNLATHIYGGVMPADYRNAVTPVSIRDSINSNTKDYLAAIAANYVNNGDIIFLDSSSTVKKILYYLKNKKDLHIITNNQKIFSENFDLDATFYCTGGKFNRASNNFLGMDVIEYIMNKNADICFFSSQGLSQSGEITDVSEQETAIRKAMIKKSKRQYFLCDSSKINTVKINTVCNISDISGVICDKQEMIENIRKNIIDKSQLKF